MEEVSYSFPVRVQPGSSRNELLSFEGGIKVRLQAPPLEGKANKACIRYFSKLLKIPKRRLKITRGEHARQKEITVFETDAPEIERIKKILGFSES